MFVVPVSLRVFQVLFSVRINGVLVTFLNAFEGALVTSTRSPCLPRYSAAAIGATAAMFVPGILVFDVTGTVADFLVSATIGGGLGAYLALRKDGIGDSVNDLGGKLLGLLD